MSSSESLDVGLLVLRLSLAWVFLYAAWRNTQNRSAWTWTINETALLFGGLPPERRQRTARLAALAGMLLMYGGGLSLLLGVEPRLGGLAIAVFSLLGTRLHAIRRDEARQAANTGNAMGWSAYSAHIAAGLKNWALAGAGILILLAGAGRYGLRLDWTGRWLGLLP